MTKNVVSVALVVVAFGIFIYSSEFPAQSTVETVLHAVTALLITIAVFVHQSAWNRLRRGAGDAADTATTKGGEST